MDLSEQVREFRVLQKTHRIRVADFCRERTLDYYEMVEALKKDKFLSELPKEEIEMSKVDTQTMRSQARTVKSCVCLTK